MKTFIEFLAQRDLPLLQEYANEALRIHEQQMAGQPEAPAQQTWYQKIGQKIMPYVAPAVAALALGGGIAQKAHAAPQDPNFGQKAKTTQTVKTDGMGKTTYQSNTSYNDTTQGKIPGHDPNKMGGGADPATYENMAKNILQKGIGPVPKGGYNSGSLKSFGPQFENMKFTAKNISGQQLNTKHPKIKGKLENLIFQELTQKAGALPVFKYISSDGNTAIIFTK